MKNYRIIVLLIALLICAGCQNDALTVQNGTSSVNSTFNSPSGLVVPTDSCISQRLSGVTYISFGGSDMEVLNSHITLKQLGSYINNDIEYALNDLGGGYFMNILDAPGMEGYQYKEKGIQLLNPIDEYGVKKKYISAIECNSEMFDFKGVRNGMNFEEIQRCIAPCETTRIEYDLPGIVSYELRYEIDGTRLVFYSWDEKGEGSFNAVIVKDFGKEDKYIRISIKQLETLFSTPKSQYIKEYGNDLICNNEDGEYAYHLIKLTFDGESLKKISLSPNYEIEGVRWGMDFNSIIGILGKNSVQEGEGEDGSYYTLTYEYSNFKLYYYAEFADDRPVPYIMQK